MPDNILFLMTDQHSVPTIGAYGNPVVQTPALDRLAATGTRFAEACTLDQAGWQLGLIGRWGTGAATSTTG